jgi:GT2 family glycosyltransferase
MIDIVIVNWNSGTQLRKLIDSIVLYHHRLVQNIVVVDNASSDSSASDFADFSGMPFKMQIIYNTSNHGFAAACNQGANLTSSEFLLFLNPDTLLFEGSLVEPIKFLKKPKNDGIGICGIKLVDDCGNSTTTAARFPTIFIMIGQIFGLSKLCPYFFPPHLMSSKDLKDSCIVDQVIGAFFLIRRNIFDQCNGFDERFFVYFEEVDLSLRAHQLGYSSFYLSSAIAYHKGGGCSDQAKYQRLFYSLRSRIYFAIKHYSRLELIILILLTMLEFPVRVIYAIFKFSMADTKNVVLAYSMLLLHFARNSR